MSESQVRSDVFGALDRALKNGYAFEGWTAAAIAEDLTLYEATLEMYDHGYLVGFVREWLQSQH